MHNCGAYNKLQRKWKAKTMIENGLRWSIWTLFNEYEDYIGKRKNDKRNIEGVKG